MIRSRLITGLTLAALCISPLVAAIPDSMAATESMDGKTIKGKVLETMDTGGYTYIHVAATEGAVWVAIPESKVSKGEEIVCNPGMTMRNFESKTLNRTFDTIIFSSGLGGAIASASSPHGHGGEKGQGPAKTGASFSEALQSEQGVGAASGTAAMGANAGLAISGGSTHNIVPSKDITVEKAKGANAYTVGECFKQRNELNNKQVKIQGKVVKVSRMIMGKNWLHIQDGSGNPMENSHDLVVTTMAEPSLDSIVVVEGTLHADKDFGAGYKYDVIIEHAEIQSK